MMRRGERGSVSVFFILITSFILLFNAVLIDYARIAATNQKLELAARAGVRSVLSAYDEQLYEQYGLFARGGTDGQEIFNHVVDERLAGGTKPADAIRWLDMRQEESHLNTAQLLGKHVVFERQVLEEMKYKAPIDFTLELINRFKSLSGQLQEAAKTADVLEKLRKLYEQRARELAKALELQRAMANTVQASALPGLIEGREGIVSISNGYPSYVSMLESLPHIQGPGVHYMLISINQYQTATYRTINQLQAADSQMMGQHQAGGSKALQAVDAAERINEQIRQLVEQADKSQAGSGYEALDKLDANGGTASAGAGGSTAELRELRNGLDKYVMPSDWFEPFRQEIRQQTEEYGKVGEAVAAFRSKVSIAMAAPSAAESYSLSDEMRRLRQVYGTYRQNYIQPASVLQSREQKLQHLSDDEQQRKEQEKKADKKWKEARKLLGGMKGLPSTEEAKKQFDQLRERYEESMRLNESSNPAQEDANEVEEAQEQATSSLSSLDSMFSGMAGSAESLMEAFYLGEYGYARFQHFEPKQLKQFFAQQEDGSGNEAMLEVSNQEMEYIVYGFHHPASNLAAAFSEIFAVRLAIRTMEGLIECRSMGHPLLVLAAAVVYGLEKAMEDMLMLVDQGSTPLSKYASVRIRYEDYLRVFMLVHGSREAKLSRMMALIELKTGYRLIQMPTGISGEVTASVKLWFLPGIMKQLARTGLFEGKVVGRRYETSKTLGWSYS
ncbi:DUF5702 domain-containing protein [Paenibacillus sp. SYP-B4298]|uniref:DUF5702 domain-containing protein n=1 Tax=Paenibacillus sp. SYP-B4298 TaxID=2996034 RepID=UPI0022DE30AC|nr:DUF5702 domain-containing protein [Paenibacillus sp. SYP-B4298]